MDTTELKSLTRLKRAGKLNFWSGNLKIPEYELWDICDEIQAEHDQAIRAMLEPETCCFAFDQEASDRCQGPVYSCNKCGVLVYTDETNEGKFKFCPNCRRRVEQ